MDDRKSQLTWGIFTAAFAATAWLIASIGAPPRFTWDPLKLSIWQIVSASLNLLLAAFLIMIKKRKIAFIPLFFSVQPVAYIAMYWIAVKLIGIDYSDMNRKFFTDILFFILEMAMFAPFFFWIDDKNPFRVKGLFYDGKVNEQEKLELDWSIPLFILFNKYKRNSLFGKKQKPQTEQEKKKWYHFRRSLIWFFFWLHTAVTLYVAIILPFVHRIPLHVFLRLIGVQMVFAVLLGLKEEIFFRWILLKGLEKIFKSRILILLLQALPWGIYHAFFGEGTGRGPIGFGFTFIGAMWYGYLVLEFDSIWLAFFCHLIVEIAGFYNLYGALIGM
jgi:membrane protease YdiL (CAAX protease family)